MNAGTLKLKRLQKMKVLYKNLEIDYDIELVDDKPLYYGSAWANPEALLCDGGDMIEEMCENVYNAVTKYNS